MDKKRWINSNPPYPIIEGRVLAGGNRSSSCRLKNPVPCVLLWLGSDLEKSFRRYPARSTCNEQRHFLKTYDVIFHLKTQESILISIFSSAPPKTNPSRPLLFLSLMPLWPLEMAPFEMVMRDPMTSKPFEMAPFLEERKRSKEGDFWPEIEGISRRDRT